jgi:hypothetical protein
VKSPGEKLRIIVGGLVGQFPLGGVAWDYFHYVLGLSELGHDVYYYEDTWVWPHDPLKGHPTDDPSYTVQFIGDFFSRYAPHLTDRWCYVLLHDRHYGMSRERFDEIARSADIFLNVSGACFFPDALNPGCVRAFMDTDPGYNQIVMHEKPAWSEHVDRWLKQVLDHDRHLTYAENIYGDDCVVPHVGIDWQPTRCVVTLPQWKAVRETPPPDNAAFTTVMSWSYFRGPLTYCGVTYDAKASEYAKFHDLPRRVNVPLTLAVGGWHQPAEQIREDGWNLVDARARTTTADDYVSFIRDSAGEWSIAKNVYVAMRTGWFSCRTACYLAAGRPAVVQETGWSRFVPSGEGVVAFSTMDECTGALQSVARDPTRHRLAAYEIARQYLAPDRVLPPMLEAIFRPRRDHPTTPGPIPPSLSDTGAQS